MKKVVWSETRIESGQPFSGALPHPPTVTRPFQNVPLFDFLAMISGQRQRHRLSMPTPQSSRIAPPQVTFQYRLYNRKSHPATAILI
jgi:hypothetical protein